MPTLAITGPGRSQLHGTQFVSPRVCTNKKLDRSNPDSNQAR